MSRGLAAGLIGNWRTDPRIETFCIQAARLGQDTVKNDPFFLLAGAEAYKRNGRTEAPRCLPTHRHIERRKYQERDRSRGQGIDEPSSAYAFGSNSFEVW